MPDILTLLQNMFIILLKISDILMLRKANYIEIYRSEFGEKTNMFSKY